MPDLQSTPVIRLPQITLAEDLESALPLEHTHVSAQVTGPVVSAVVTQRFRNPLKEPAELDYLFPLPEDAALAGFELRIGDRKISGDLQENQAAAQAYEQARSEGKLTGLIEQRRPNLFAVRLANVKAGETIQAVVRYQQRVKLADGVYEFVFPMGITPKYDSPEHPQEGQGVHAPIAGVEDRIGPVEIEMAVDAGLAVEDPSSPSHPLQVNRIDERRFQIRLAGEHIPDRDFVLRYTIRESSQVQAAGWTSGEAGKEYFLASLLPPAVEHDSEAQPPREFIFVLDRSGSMTGEPIAQARNALRACLRTLHASDTFRILLFDNHLEWFQPEPSLVSQEAVDQADAYLARVQGRGGTEIVRALEAVLTLPEDKERIRYVVFLTDGAVSAEARALEQIRSRLGRARLFTFGIGSAVNRAFISRMARLGRGRVTFLQLDEDIEGAIIRFQDSVSFPILTDLVLEWQNAKPWDVYPARLPELYEGEPLEITGRLARTGGPVQMTLRGQRDGQPVEIRLSLPEAQALDPAVARVWARARIEDLLEQQELEPEQADKIKAEILGLALEHNLVTVHTSFVAVDQQATIAASTPPRIIHVAQPLPFGVYPGTYRQPGRGLPPIQASLYAAAPMPPTGAPRGRTLMAKMFIADDAALGQKPQAEVNFLRQGSQEVEKTPDRQSTLRWLARTQNLDGSWNSSGEQTAAALLAFVRAGFTTRAGTFRAILRKAVRWLVDHRLQGLDAYLRARALQELAEATGSEEDRAAAQGARLVLPDPSNDLEAAALGKGGRKPQAINTLDDLRAAALLVTPLGIPEALLKNDLGRIWAAAIQME